MEVEPNHIRPHVSVFEDPSNMALKHIAGHEDEDDTSLQGADRVVEDHKR